MHHQPNGPAFDVVLILHVGCVVVSLVTLVTDAATADRLGRVRRDGATLPEAVARYYRPGVNWAGRSVYGIPVFGFALLALSHGAYSFRDGWVLAGLAILVLMVVVAEGTLWPAERRLQASLVGGGVSAGGPLPDPEGRVGRDVRAVVVSAGLALALLVLGSALMVAQP